MRVQLKTALSIAASLLLLFAPTSAQAQKKKGKKGGTPTAAPSKKTGPKPYAKVITKDAESESGLFSVHRVDEKYYFELPNELL